MTDEATNGSAGRFLRIEAKIDGLVDDFADFRVEVAGRLTALEAVGKQQNERVSMATYKWMRAGIVASFVIGLVSIGIRVVWG